MRFAQGALERKNVRVGVAQAASVAFDQPRSLEKLRDIVADAAREKVEFMLFPEAFVPGYPRGFAFAAPVGYRSEDARDAFAAYHEAAVDVPGPAIDFLVKVARDYRMFLAVGVVEREFGTLYCSVLFVSPDSGYLGKHRKVMPTAAERLFWGYGDGSTLPVFQTKFGNVGAVICWENYMPLIRAAMYGQGIEIYLAPTADMRDSWLPSMQHIAVEGRCFVLSCNQFSRRRDFPEVYPNSLGEDPEVVISRGGSCIIDPLGKIIAGPNYSEEVTLIADIDLNDIKRGKFDFDPVGHYSRPDIFQLHVDARPKKPVWLEGGRTASPAGPIQRTFAEGESE
jgi:nitrilase